MVCVQGMRPRADSCLRAGPCEGPQTAYPVRLLRGAAACAASQGGACTTKTVSPGLTYCSTVGELRRRCNRVASATFRACRSSRCCSGPGARRPPRRKFRCAAQVAAQRKCAPTARCAEAPARESPTCRASCCGSRVPPASPGCIEPPTGAAGTPVRRRRRRGGRRAATEREDPALEREQTCAPFASGAARVDRERRELGTGRRCGGCVVEASGARGVRGRPARRGIALRRRGSPRSAAARCTSPR